MIRKLTILAATAALAVSAAPPASAGPSKEPPPRGTTAHEYGHLTHYLINASGGWDPTFRAVRTRGPHVIASLNVKYT
jgi:hypothetical protein